MKRLYIISILILNTVCLYAQDAMTLAHKGDDHYRNGEYTEAIECYEQVLSIGMTSAELHYNLAGAYYRNNQIGMAILNYERALRIQPSMKDAKENLTLAESRTIDNISPVPQFFFARWYNALCHAMPPATWRIIWIVLLSLLCISFIVFQAGHSIKTKKTSLICGTISLLLLLFASTLLLSTTHKYNAHSEAIIIDPTITVKSSPENNSVDKLLLHEGTKVTILDELNGWYKIRIADGTTGWCDLQTIERI